MHVSDAACRLLADLLRVRTGQHLAISRRWRIETALKALLRESRLTSLDDLVALIVADRDPNLAERVVEALLNNETYWFRDRGPFDLLRTDILPQLNRERAASKRVSVWCAGCSTGQEAYSIAMLFAEAQAEWAGWTIDIVGTDVSRRAIAQARAGTYSQFEVQRGLPLTLMVRHFVEEGGAWQINDTMRRAVRFQPQSLAAQAPGPGRFDLILCRNVLMYFGQLQRDIAFGRLANACAPDGLLLLGAGETVIGQTTRFETDRASRGFYRLSHGGRVPRLAMGA